MAGESVSELETLLDGVLDYEETGSLADAKSAISYAKRLLARRRSSASHSSSSHSFDNGQLRQILEDARSYVAANNNTGRVSYLNMSNNWR